MLAAQVRDRFAQVDDRNRLDACQRDLRRRLCGADQAYLPVPVRPVGDCDRTGDGPDASVQPELAERGVLREALQWDLPRRGEDGERNGEVEAGSLLAQCRRREVDGDPALGRPGQPRRRDACPDAVLRLLTGSVGQPHDRERGQPAWQVCLHVHAPRLEADECIRDRAREHPATLGRVSVRACAAFVPEP